MVFKDLKAVMLPEDRCIFRLYSSGDQIIDSGAVVLMNLGDALDSAEVALVYVAECIQHVDLRVSDQEFNNTNWEQVFGKEVFRDKQTTFPNSF